MIYSCKKDDDDQIETIPPRLLSEVMQENDSTIQVFITTHFYNYTSGTVDTIAGDHANETPLADVMQVETINVSSNAFDGLEEENNVPHKLYYLILEEGTGTAPAVADSAYVKYEGNLLSGEVFDSNVGSPIWFDLASIQGFGAARGFAEGTTKIKSGGDVVVNDDGTFTVNGYGVGLLIFPSGLGYFNVIRPNLPAYSPMMFKISLLTHVSDVDHDNDGIPSMEEDLNGNGYLYDDNTDRDEEIKLYTVEIANNFRDGDDDGDGIGTLEEISDENGNIITPYPDTDGDGTPDYLDPDS